MASSVTAPGSSSSSLGFTAVGIFFFFAMTMAFYAGLTLLYPGTALDRLWSLNPVAHRDLLPFRTPAGLMFLVIAVLAATGGFGWFRRRMWAWRLAVFGISTQVLGDCVNLIRGDFLRGGPGLLIGAALLIYLLSARIKSNFNSAPDCGEPADQKVSR